MRANTATPNEAPPHRLVDMCGLTFQPERITGLDADGLPPAVQLLVAARTGLVAPGHLARLRERGEVEHVTVPVDRSHLAQVLRFAWTGRPETGVRFTEQEFLDDLPLAQSRLVCSWVSAFDADADSEPLVVMCGDSAEDFCYAYTRQRVVADAHWLPVGPDTAGLDLELYTELLRLLYDLAVPPVSARPVLLSSLTLDEYQLHEVRDRLLATRWGRMAASGSQGRLDVRVCAPADLPVRRRLHLLDKAHVGDTLHEPFLGTDQARNVEIPLPSEAVGIQLDSCRWQVDVLDSKAVLPARWALNDVITATSPRGESTPAHPVSASTPTAGSSPSPGPPWPNCWSRHGCGFRQPVRCSAPSSRERASPWRSPTRAATPGA